MGWTESQQNAIDARGRNILVSAAAGSGKTAVLVARVIKLITDRENPVDIDKFLIVTFTNAAAAEMKSRISAGLQEKLRTCPGDPLIMRQLSLLPGAQICTIDSFCLDSMSIDITSKLLNSMQKEIRDLLTRDVGKTEGALASNKEEGQAENAKKIEQQLVLALSLVQLIESKLIELLRDKVKLLSLIDR